MSTRVPADLGQLYEGAPRVSRAALEAAFGVLLARALRAAGVSVTAAARELGMPRPHLYRYIVDEAADEDPEMRLPAAWLFRLPAPALAELLNPLLRPLGLCVVDLPRVEEPGVEMELLERLHRETAEAIQATFSAGASLHWTRSVTDHLRRELLDAVRVLLSGVAMCDEVARGGAPVARGPRLVQGGA